MFGTVQRFICHACHHTFSTQSFAPSYYLKTTINLSDLFTLHASSMSGRALARYFCCSCSAIQNRIDRLARQAISLHCALRPFLSTTTICVDGFVSFDRSQFFPNEITIAIASPSRFVLDLSHAVRKRSGALTPAQRAIVKHCYATVNFQKGAIDRTFSDQLDVIAQLHHASQASPLLLVTDEKPSYTRLLAHHLLRLSPHVVHHIRIPGTLPRTAANPLFASNYFDRELRKDQANHRRETGCFCRNVANGLSRLVCYLVYHNYWKKYLIKSQVLDTRTHGECAGVPLKEQQRGMIKLFLERAIYTRESWMYSPTLRRVWMKEDPTPGKQGFEHLARFVWT
ncbi:MAG: hypothetical protein PHT55_03650 [Spirochaetales bacterium]|nr:hypothetical protein [Spirochaetales bacterium]